MAETTEQASGQRFFDSRASFNMFVNTTDEKVEAAERVARESREVEPGQWALRIFDAGMGDATVLGLLMRRLHRTFTHVPWRVVGKEISVEDVRHALGWLPDRMAEHPEMVFVVTNLRYSDATRLGSEGDVRWRVHTLDGDTAHDFELQIRAVHPIIESDWKVMTSARTGNPVPAHPSVHVFYRSDRSFILKNVIPRPGLVDGEYDLMIASQPYRRQLGGEHPDLEFLEQSDEEAVFRYRLNAMPSERQENIGTSSVLAAWNAAAYVAQIEEARLAEALASGAYLGATRGVLEKHGGVWFNDESFVISRRRHPG
jgi:hypothetical protein